MSYTYGSKHVDPLEEAVITVSLKQAKDKYWVVNMRAQCRGWTPTQEQFPVKVEADVKEIS